MNAEMLKNDDAIEWHREIWARERDDFDVMGIHVFSEWATVPRYEGDVERECEYHRYVDGDIYDSAEKYHREMLEAARADNIALQAEVERLREALGGFLAFKIHDCADPDGAYRLDSIAKAYVKLKRQARAALADTREESE